MKIKSVIILLFILSNLLGQTKTLIPYSCNGIWGYSDTLGSVLITPEFDTVQVFCQNLAVVGREGLFGVIDIGGKIILPCKFEEVKSFDVENNCLRARLNDKWLVFNRSGEKIKKRNFQYSVLYDCVEILPFGGMAQVYLYSKDNKYGFVKYKCKDAAKDSCKDYKELKFDDYFEIGTDVLALKSAGEWMLYDYTGKLLSDNKYDYIDCKAIGRRGEYYFRIGNSGKIGLIDLAGNEVVEPIYDCIEELDGSFYLVSAEWYFGNCQLFRAKVENREFYINQNGMEYTCH